MSDALTLRAAAAATTASICPCGSPTYPWVIFNPPNQPAIAYRIGDYGAIRQALLRALPGEAEICQKASTVNT